VLDRVLNILLTGDNILEKFIIPVNPKQINKKYVKFIINFYIKYMLNPKEIEELIKLQEESVKEQINTNSSHIRLIKNHLTDNVTLNRVKVKKRNLFYRSIDSIRFFFFRLRKKYNIKLPKIKINID
jgi:hypothetical protein